MTDEIAYVDADVLALDRSDWIDDCDAGDDDDFETRWTPAIYEDQHGLFLALPTSHVPTQLAA